MWSIVFALFAVPADAATVPDEFGTIQEAIDHALPGDTITVAPGEYYEQLHVTFDLTIEGEDALDVTRLLPGGGERMITVEPGARLALRQVTLDGEFSEGGIHAMEGSEVRFERSVCEHTVAESGGCILVEGGRLWVSDSRFYASEALEGAHIAGQSGAEITVDRSRFLYGQAEGGGAIVVMEGVLRLQNSRFESNTAPLGGAVGLGQSVLEVNDTWFHFNMAYAGGALFAHNTEVRLDAATMIGNWADSEGGALFAYAAPELRLHRVAMVENESTEQGGGLFVGLSPQIVVSDSIWLGNASGVSGGAAAFYRSGSVEVVDTMVRNNDASYGGGISVQGHQEEPGYAALARNVFCDNEASYEGGAVHVGQMGSTLMMNSILHRNHAYMGGGLFLRGGMASVGYNLFLESRGYGFDGAAAFLDSPDFLESGYNHYAYSDAGIAFASLLSSTESYDDNWYENMDGDHYGLLPLGPEWHEEPAFRDYSPWWGGCTEHDFRPDPSVSTPVEWGPWSTTGEEVFGSSRWYEDRDGDGEIGLTDCDDSDAERHSDTIWYLDGDGDGYGDDNSAEQGCFPPGADWVLQGGDCDLGHPGYHTELPYYLDQDGDGYGDSSTETWFCVPPSPDWVSEGGDCDDSDPAVSPATIWYADLDGDGYGDRENTYGPACQAPPEYVLDDSDCDDTNPLIHPMTLWYADMDGDGYGDLMSPAGPSCARPPGHVLNSDDCDDDDPQVNPGAIEVCNGIDDDCDGFTDNNSVDAGIWAPDDDGDGFGDDFRAEALCDPPPGWVQLLGDCDDSNEEIYPGAVEVCDGIDNDCNGLIDDDAIDASPWYVDADGDGWGDEQKGSVLACDPPDGYGPAGDCDDEDPAIHPDAAEICNGLDDNCNGLIDDEDPTLDPDAATAWYLDADGDGLGDPDSEVLACEAPDGYIDQGGDCNDADPEIGRCAEIPGHPEHIPPSSGKADQAPPDGPERYGVACQHGGGQPMVPGILALLGALVWVRRRVDPVESGDLRDPVA